jgi:hypothetical protein
VIRTRDPRLPEDSSPVSKWRNSAVSDGRFVYANPCFRPHCESPDSLTSDVGFESGAGVHNRAFLPPQGALRDSRPSAQTHRLTRAYTVSDGSCDGWDQLERILPFSELLLHSRHSSRLKRKHRPVRLVSDPGGAGRTDRNRQRSPYHGIVALATVVCPTGGDAGPPHEQTAGLTDVGASDPPRSRSAGRMHRMADRLKRPGHVEKRPGTGANSRTAMVRLQAPRRRSGLRDKQGSSAESGSSAAHVPIRAFQLTS